MTSTRPKGGADAGTSRPSAPSSSRPVPKPARRSDKPLEPRPVESVAPAASRESVGFAGRAGARPNPRATGCAATGAYECPVSCFGAAASATAASRRPRPSDAGTPSARSGRSTLGRAAPAAAASTAPRSSAAGSGSTPRQSGSTAARPAERSAGSSTPSSIRARNPTRTGAVERSPTSAQVRAPGESRCRPAARPARRPETREPRCATAGTLDAATRSRPPGVPALPTVQRPGPGAVPPAR